MRCVKCGKEFDGEKTFHWHTPVYEPVKDGDSMLLGRTISKEVGPAVEYPAPWSYIGEAR